MTTSTSECAPGDIDSVDLRLPAVHAEYDLSEYWATLRDEHPVYRHDPDRDGTGFWVISRHEDVQALLRDVRRFPSERGNGLDTLLAGGDPAGGRMLAVTDGRRHAALRKIVMQSFTPRFVSTLVEGVELAARQYVGEALQQGEVDFVAAVAEKIPLDTVCDLLDIPQADRAYLVGLTSTSLAGTGATAERSDAFAAKNDILMYFYDLLEERRDPDRGDIVSGLVAAEIDGEPLDEFDVVLNCYSLMLAGDETTRLAMAGAVQMFLAEPGLWASFRDGEIDLDLAVEEILRVTTPTLHAGRYAAESVELHGRRIAEGDVVTLWTASANFDPRAFGNPAAVDLARADNKHLTFAYGPHYCLGAFLARAEIKALLVAMREQVRELRACGRPQRIYSNFLSGYASLPVALSA
ncbi:cytochrome P450 [Nocardia sp. NPDC020380]|uniref:cytochrome P450 n=1 Tax=Nocardia sp. NPDC020380 TaxID=3364309 RepID=UPI0037A3DA7E